MDENEELLQAKKLLTRLVNAVGDCEDTNAVLAIAKDAAILLDDGSDLKYYRDEINTMMIMNLRAVTAAEYLLKHFDEVYAPKPEQAKRKSKAKK